MASTHGFSWTWPENGRSGTVVAGLCGGGDLRGQKLRRGIEIDQRIDLELRRNDIGPFVQDAMQDVIAIDLEYHDRAAADARIDVLANTGRLIRRHPRPEALPCRRHI